MSHNSYPIQAILLSWVGTNMELEMAEDSSLNWLGAQLALTQNKQQELNNEPVFSIITTHLF